jgi:hypothetical protein
MQSSFGLSDDVSSGTYPTNEGHPAETFLEGDVHVTVDTVRTHKVGEAPGIPPICVDLRT